jgi:hypothetical protein
MTGRGLITDCHWRGNSTLDAFARRILSLRTRCYDVRERRDPVATNLSEQEREALREAPGAPVPVIDPQTNRVYYLISGEQFEKIRPLLMEDEFDPRAMYPLTAKTAGEAGWIDPAMDDYDRYDELRPREPR